MGNLEGSNGPRRVVQSLWSGDAAAVHRLASPRPVSGRVRNDDRDGVADRRHVVVKMRPSQAAGRPKQRARRKMDTVLQALLDDKTDGIRHIAVHPRSAPRMLGTRRCTLERGILRGSGGKDAGCRSRQAA